MFFKCFCKSIYFSLSLSLSLCLSVTNSFLYHTWRCQKCLLLRPHMSPHGLPTGIFQLNLNVFWCLEMWGRIVPELPLELYSSRGNQVRLKCHFRMVPLSECSVCVSIYIYIYIHVYMYIREVELVSSNLTNLPNDFHHLWHWSALSSDLAVRASRCGASAQHFFYWFPTFGCMMSSDPSRYVVFGYRLYSSFAN